MVIATLPVDVENGDGGHAELHNDVNGAVNQLATDLSKVPAALRAPKVPGSLVTLGTSVTGSDYSGGGLWPTHAVRASGRRLALIANKGVGGNTSAQMLARFDTDVVALNPAIVTIEAFTNDIQNGVPLATSQQNIKDMAAKADAAGITPVFLTAPPRGAHTGTAQIAYVQRFNTWLRLWAAFNGYAVIDAFNVLADRRNGGLRTGQFYDATHPNYVGQALLGYEAARVLLDLANRRHQRVSLAPVYGEWDYAAGGLGTTTAYGPQLVANPLFWDNDNDTIPELWTSTAVASMHTASTAGATQLLLTQKLTPGTYRAGFGAAQAETIIITAVTGSAAPYTATLQTPAANPHPIKQVIDTAALVITSKSDETTRFADAEGRVVKITGTGQTGATDALVYALPPKDAPWLTGESKLAWSIGDTLRLVGRVALEAPSNIPGTAAAATDTKGIDVKLRFNGAGTDSKALAKFAAPTPTGLAIEFGSEAVVPAGTTSIDVVVTVDLGGGNATVYLSQVGVWNLTQCSATGLSFAA